jgi:hypothetical protein
MNPILHPIVPRPNRRALAPAALGAALLACASCSTQEIGSNEIAVSATPIDGAHGFLIVALASGADSYEQDQARILQGGANLVEYEINVDGKRLIDDNGGMPWPLGVGEGSESSCGYLPAGVHGFEIVDSSDGHAVFAGDYDLLGGQVNRLYLFGHLDALEGSFVSYPYAPPAGMQHVSLTNLLRTGQSIEVVSCSGGDPEVCTSISPPVASGESFDADFPGPAPTPGSISLNTPAPGFGYRQVPTASVPTPPALAFFFAVGPPPIATDVNQSPANYVEAPIFMAADGSPQASFN